MTPVPDWNDPAAVKRYHRKVIRRALLRFGLLPILIGLLPVAGFTGYRQFYPLSEQEHLRRRERRKANLDQPVTKRDLRPWQHGHGNSANAETPLAPWPDPRQPIRARSVVSQWTTASNPGVWGVRPRSENVSCGLLARLFSPLPVEERRGAGNTTSELHA